MELHYFIIKTVNLKQINFIINIVMTSISNILESSLSNSMKSSLIIVGSNIIIPDYQLSV